MEVLKLKVKLDKKQFIVEIDKKDTIDDLKAAIYDLEDIPGFMQELVLGDGTKIDDVKKTVEEYKLTPDTIITVNVKVREVDTSTSSTCNPGLNNKNELVEA